MPFTYEADFDNHVLKNEQLTQEMEGLRRFVTPDVDLEGKDMLGYRLEREKDSVIELGEMLDKNTYIDHALSEEQNNAQKEAIIAQIKEHEKEIQHLENQRIEIPKAIQRLEAIKQAQKNDMAAFKVSKDTTREEIKAVLKAIEARLKEEITQEEKRMLSYLQGHLETAKTTIDTGKQLEDMNLFLQQKELMYLGNLEPLKPQHNAIAISILETILQEVSNEQARLRQKGSNLADKYTDAIEKISARVNEAKAEPDTIQNKDKMKETVEVLSTLNDSIQREKDASPSFKDRVRNFVNGFRSFMQSAFGVKIGEVASLRSKTMTNLFKTQKEAQKLSDLVPRNNQPDQPEQRGPRI